VERRCKREGPIQRSAFCETSNSEAKSVKRYLAEFIGTFVLVTGGVGSAVLAGDKIGFVGVSFAFGLSLLAMVYAVGPISGCHVNPAVTVGLVMAGKLPKRDVPGYVIAQIGGAIAAAGLVLLIAQSAPAGYDPGAAGLAANGFGEHSPGHYGLAGGFIAEVVLTFLLVFTVLGATDARAPAGFAGLPIGLVLTLIHLVGIPLTNTSVNPARSIGPAVFVGGWAIEQLWLFVGAPLGGAVLAALVHASIRAPEVAITAAEAERALKTEEEDRIVRHRPEVQA
jgi:aquaporin Z